MSSVAKIDLLQRQLEREKKARQEAEQLLEEKSADLYRVNIELTQAYSGREKYLKVLGDFAEAVTRLESVDELGWYVAREVVGKLGFSDCVFYLYDPEDDCLVQRAAIAEKNPVGNEILNPLRIPLGHGVTGSVALNRKAEIVDDVLNDERYVADVGGGGSELCVPMLHHNQLIGVIDCEDPEKKRFTEDHLSTLETIASYASAKVAERTAHEAVMERTYELENKVEELTRLSEELEKAREKAEESSALKSRFVATISHEIRTPLAGILGSLDLLQDEGLEGKPEALVNMARTSGNTLQTLLNDVIDFARTEAGTLQLEPVAFSLSELVASVQSFWQPHLEARGSSVAIDMDHNLAKTYWGDLARIRQILNNYISNALKYAGKGRIILAIEAHGEDVRFSVTDNGSGLSKEDQDQLFNEFTRVGSHKRQIGDGAGLGLAICRQMADLMGGSVGVESQLGNGCCFWLKLPLKPTEKKVERHNKNTSGLTNFKEHLGRRPRILVAEDVATNQTIIRMTLEGFGCNTTIVNNGIEAVEAVRAHNFDLVFMDIAMPEMDGVAATARIHSLMGPKKAPPIFALTAHGMDSDREEFEAAGMIGIVTKPFDRTDLHAAIASVLCLGLDQAKPEIEEHADESTVFDTEQLLGLIGELDQDSQCMLLEQCVLDIAKCLNTLKTGLTERKFALISDAAHQLKSVSGTFGLTEIQILAGEASTQGREEDEACLSTTQILIQKLPHGIAELEAFLKGLQE